MAPITNASVVICSPTLGVATVDVTVNADGMIDKNNIQAYGQDLTFQPTGGLALNGLSYPLDRLDVRTSKYAFLIQHSSLTCSFIIEQRLKNIQFQFTDAIYATVIKGLDIPELQGLDIQDQLFYTMRLIYQTYLSIRMSCHDFSMPLVDTCTFQLLRLSFLCPLIMAAPFKRYLMYHYLIFSFLPLRSIFSQVSSHHYPSPRCKLPTICTTSTIMTDSLRNWALSLAAHSRSQVP
jgi:hypothetical protein